jgi:CRP/FNR family transcriptional regulator, cyclic AMP receptor protein
MAASPQGGVVLFMRFPNRWKADHQPMRSNVQTPPESSFDFSGVVTLNGSFATGGIIFAPRDVADTLMYIQTGRVKLSVLSKTNKEVIIALLGPGEFLGEGCLGRRNVRTRTATAIAPTVLRIIKRKEMIRALHADPALSDSFLSYLISRNIRIEKDLIDQHTQPSEKRLARALLLLAGTGDRRKLHRFVGISQETLATMIGTTRSRVNFFMNKFRRLGFVRYRGRLGANGGMHINCRRLAKALRR